jgi:hypothetical protein
MDDFSDLDLDLDLDIDLDHKERLEKLIKAFDSLSPEEQDNFTGEIQTLMQRFEKQNLSGEEIFDEIERMIFQKGKKDYWANGLDLLK